MMMQTEGYSRQYCEYLRLQGKQKFQEVMPDWLECTKWAAPNRGKWMRAMMSGGLAQNQHIVDPTHIIALRSYVAGFLEGNTSASRPWFRSSHRDPDRAKFPANKEWLEKLTARAFNVLSTSNFYDSCAQAYYDYGVVNNTCQFIDETKGRLYYHNLMPGSYTVINNNEGEPIVLIREFSKSILDVVDTYARKVDGHWDWTNFSDRVRRLYEEGNYVSRVDICQVVMENRHYRYDKPQGGTNRKWINLTYEMGSGSGVYYEGTTTSAPLDPKDDSKFLSMKSSKRKPFVLGRSQSSNNGEYGEMGPTIQSLGLIRSLNKKAISKDIAIERMISPPVQGPASLRKSYVTTNSNAFVPLDRNADAGKGLRSIYEINPSVVALTTDVQDGRTMIDKFYYSDFLLYLIQNPKTRTATETNAILAEQQLVIGPNLQSLNWTYNNPHIDFVLDFVLDEDPYLEPAPDSLQGEFLKTEIISPFASAQKAADLPAIDRYAHSMLDYAKFNPKVFDKVNLDKLADLYEDRLFLPAGLNNAQSKVEKMRAQAEAQAQRQQMLNETLPNMAGAAADMSKAQGPK